MGTAGPTACPSVCKGFVHAQLITRLGFLELSVSLSQACLWECIMSTQEFASRNRQRINNTRHNKWSFPTLTCLAFSAASSLWEKIFPSSPNFSFNLSLPTAIFNPNPCMHSDETGCLMWESFSCTALPVIFLHGHLQTSHYATVAESWKLCWGSLLILSTGPCFYSVCWPSGPLPPSLLWQTSSTDSAAPKLSHISVSSNPTDFLLCSDLYKRLL